jgi:hypothetical protein
MGIGEGEDEDEDEAGQSMQMRQCIMEFEKNWGRRRGGGMETSRKCGCSCKIGEISPGPGPEQLINAIDKINVWYAGT